MFNTNPASILKISMKKACKLSLIVFKFEFFMQHLVFQPLHKQQS